VKKWIITLKELPQLILIFKRFIIITITTSKDILNDSNQRDILNNNNQQGYLKICYLFTYLGNPIDQ
jgi:hypothetical protein